MERQSCQNPIPLHSAAKLGRDSTERLTARNLLRHAAGQLLLQPGSGSEPISVLKAQALTASHSGADSLEVGLVERTCIALW